MANKSLDFNGSTQYASIADESQTGLDLSTGDFTIEFWVKFDSLPGSGLQEWAVSKWYDGSSTNYRFGIQDDGTVYFSAGDDLVSTTTLSTGSWYHLAFVWDDNSSMTIYIDGSFNKTKETTTTRNNNNAAPFVIGADYNNGIAGYIDGKIDEVRVWNDVRTVTEISTNYKKELVGTETGLVAYYKFNDSALDETSNDNDLTLSGSPSYSIDVPFFTLAVATMALTLTYADVTLKRAVSVVVDTMSLALTFADVNLIGPAKELIVDTMALSLTFSDIVLKKTMTLATNTMALLLDFKDVVLKSTSWSNDTKPTSSWTEDTKPSDTWTNDSK